VTSRLDKTPVLDRFQAFSAVAALPTKLAARRTSPGLTAGRLRQRRDGDRTAIAQC